MTADAPRRGRPFTPAGALLAKRIRKAGEKRGFFVTRMLTHWAEIVGPEIAARCQPVSVQIPRQENATGATLVVLARGANGPMLQMQIPRILERINAAYGYRAVAKVRITQTAGGLLHAPPPPPPEPPRPPGPQACATARAAAQTVTDPALRAALAALGARVLDRG